jgi:hypothetical protein
MRHNKDCVYQVILNFSNDWKYDIKGEIYESQDPTDPDGTSERTGKDTRRPHAKIAPVRLLRLVPGGGFGC